MESRIERTSSCEDIDEPGLIPVGEALSRMLAASTPVSGYEEVELSEALGRVLYGDLISPRAVPGHTNSAVDGYAVRTADLPYYGPTGLRVVGAAFAGQPYGRPLGPGETVRIMTGARMPDGANAVVMQEHAAVRGEWVRITDLHRPGQNVRSAGEDLGAGEPILAAGRWLTPADLGLIASIGQVQVQVRRRPRVALLSTGNEVRPLGEDLPEGAIYDSNRYTLRAALQRMGLPVRDLGIVSDCAEVIAERLAGAAGVCDLIITTGGVSVGDADFIRPVLGELGRIEFWKVAMKPGRPMAFGRINDATFFGLPGNPVAVLVTFYQFVRPFLEQCMGITDRPLIPLLRAETTERLRKKPGRTEYQRAVLRQTGPGAFQVALTGRQGSGILRSMSLANALIILEHERGEVQAGEWVSVLPFSALL